MDKQKKNPLTQKKQSKNISHNEREKKMISHQTVHSKQQQSLVMFFPYSLPLVAIFFLRNRQSFLFFFFLTLTLYVKQNEIILTF